MAIQQKCPRAGCPSVGGAFIIKTGKFFRRDDSRWIQRFRCRRCLRNFSSSTNKDTCWQKRRRINEDVRWLFCSKVSQRGIARYLKVDRKTVAFRLPFLAKRSRAYFAKVAVTGLRSVQFDEMQSSIHTKCKPVAIPMAVDSETRMILALGVASMPAQAPLIDKALRKYGPRADDREGAIVKVLERIRPMLAQGAQITTDSAFRYPSPIRRHLPEAIHMTVKGRKSSAGGQGELKKIGFDPIFAFNHTAAMVRDSVARLIRKTWCNSKRMDRLEDHLYIYSHHHNLERLPILPKGA